MIIGITGPNGSGKSTVAKAMADQWGFVYLSAREYLTEELNMANVEVTRMAMNELANQIRTAEGPIALFERMLVKAGNHANIVIESVRCPGEVDLLIQKGGILIGVDAPRQLRYERAILRGSSTDKISIEQFVREEELEATSTDPNKQNISTCMQRAEISIKNDSDNLERLQSKIIILGQRLGL